MSDLRAAAESLRNQADGDHPTGANFARALAAWLDDAAGKAGSNGGISLTDATALNLARVTLGEGQS